MAHEWEDRGIVLSLRPHGETDAVLTLLTEHRGRHAGLVHGGDSRKQRSVLQPGNMVHARWHARLETQLGTLTVESLRSFAAFALTAPLKLAGLNAVCAMLDMTLPEREPHPGIFHAALELLEHLGDVAWNAHYVRWELALLREMGYGLDLRTCAATGQTDELEFVSPRSGRAVSRAAAAPYAGRLLALPPFLLHDDASYIPAIEDIRSGLSLTGYFFDRDVFAPLRQTLPQARTRFVDLISR
jgi:DNA repair protein RecO (recombination protein O)